MNQIAMLPKFEWRPGMLVKQYGTPNERGFRVHTCKGQLIEYKGLGFTCPAAWTDPGWPDLHDHATQGAIVGLLEDVTGKTIYVEYCWSLSGLRSSWRVFSPPDNPCGVPTEHGRGDTREAALEAACLEVLK